MGKLTGQGTYAVEKGKVIWLTGPYKDDTFSGTWEIIHRIRLNLTFFGSNQGASESKHPRFGKYMVYQGGFSFELAPDGRYKAMDFSGTRAIGEGQYIFDAKENIIRWLTGPYKDKMYRGAFTVERYIVLDRNKKAEWMSPPK